MGFLRRDHDEPTGRRFRMQTRMLSIGDDYWIEDEAGDRVFLVDGKALRVRDTWVLKDASGREVAEIRERKLSIRDAMTIHVGGQEVRVKKALVGLRDRFSIDVPGRGDLKAHGNVLDHEYEIEGDEGTLARVSKKWFRVRETYGVEVAPGADAVLMLAVTVAIDGLTRSD